MKITRDRSFRVPLTDRELAMLHELSEAEGLSAAELVRHYIRREHEKTATTKPAKKAAKR